MKRPRSALIVLIASLLALAVGFGALIVSQRQAHDQADIPTVGSRDLASLAAAALAEPDHVLGLPIGQRNCGPNAFPGS